MKRISRLTVALLLLALVLQIGPHSVAAADRITTAPTGYTCAEDVPYITYSGTIAVTSSTSYTVKDVVVNWGARGEDCTFLTAYAQDYYVGNFSWNTLSAYQGGTGTSDAYSSQLYDALQDMMQTKHTYIIDYKHTRAYFAFTDCVSNDYSQISSFYSGNMVAAAWTGKTYNREHTWPNSKGLGGADEDDIMMLRPTINSENTSRGNTAYGESSGYFDPGQDVRGDCARIALYVYTRWGNTTYMWGTSGVIESLDILLKWMAEDPVDTWEMARNDSVQSITGVRNVFVDYPELAWMLFGEEVPAGLVTPSSGGASACTHGSTEVRNAVEATCGESGYTGDTYCSTCGQKLSAGTKIAATGSHSYGDWVVTREPTMEQTGLQERVCSVCGNRENGEIPKLEAPPCDHAHTQLRDAKDATCAQDGYSGDTYCTDCGLLLRSGSTMEATGNHGFGDWVVVQQPTGTETGERTRQCGQCGFTEIEKLPVCNHANTQLRNVVDATCGKGGYSGDTYCADCGDLVLEGKPTRATGAHSYSQWEEKDGNKTRSCSVCGDSQTVAAESQPEDRNWLWIVVITVSLTAVAVVAIWIIKKKK